MLKTSVMMIGEFEFDDMFFDNPDNHMERLPYKGFTMVYFLVFMVVMPIIIMNLLVRNPKSPQGPHHQVVVLMLLLLLEE